MSEAHFQRALLLQEQGRHEMAEKELRGYLVEEPEDGLAHALLAFSLMELKRRDDAEEAARSAIAHAPDLGFTHYALAHVLMDRRRMAEAREAIGEALRLEPTHPDFYSALSAIEFSNREWEAALRAAETGLQFDAEHVSCNNLRAMALVKLGLRADAGATIDHTLSREPENSTSHANMGWTLLEQGKRKEAMEHFRESLRLDPTNDWARAGLVEALKAGNPIYAVMLRYFLWMEKLSERAGWGVVIGAYLGYRLVNNLADAIPAMAPWLMPILVLYVGFALLSWLAQPLFNVVVFAHPVGRHALSDDQRHQAALVGATVGLAFLSAGAAFVVPLEADLIWLAIVFGLLSLPTSAIHKCSKGWPRRRMAWLTGGLAAVGLASWTVLEVVRPESGTRLFELGDTGLVLFFIGVLASQFVANWLMQQLPAR